MVSRLVELVSRLLLLAFLCAVSVSCPYKLPDFNNPYGIDGSLNTPDDELDYFERVASRATFLPENYTANYGTYSLYYSLQVGSTPGLDAALHYALLGFDDLEEFSGRQLVQAHLSVHVFSILGLSQGAVADVPLYVHEVLVPWKQGTGNVADDTGDTFDGATWFHYWYDIDGDPASGLPWATAGCRGAGLDYNVMLAGQVTVLAAGQYELEMDTVLVQRWIDYPDTNYGLLLTDADLRRFRLDVGGLWSAYPPVLTLTF